MEQIVLSLYYFPVITEMSMEDGDQLIEVEMDASGVSGMGQGEEVGERKNNLDEEGDTVKENEKDSKCVCLFINHCNNNNNNFLHFSKLCCI